MMSRVARIVTAAFAALALLALPILPDYCADSCEALAAAASAPPCHHAAPVAAHVGRVPIRCNHDHHVTAALPAAPAPIGASWASVAALELAPTPFVLFSLDRRPAGESPPDPASSLQRRPLPLRL
jgi:hypothetical protein